MDRVRLESRKFLPHDSHAANDAPGTRRGRRTVVWLALPPRGARLSSAGCGFATPSLRSPTSP